MLANRSWWAERRLKPIVESVRKEEGDAAAQKRSARMLLLTFMIAAGALAGEAFYGVEAAILAVMDEISMGGELLKTYSWWPYARLSIFVIINVALGLIVYVLFRKAGIIRGGTNNDPPRPEATSKSPPSRVMDAELAD